MAKLTFKKFQAICARQRLVAAEGVGFWTAYRPWGFGGSRLAVVTCTQGRANDAAVFRALAPLV